jgi:hypothetical protein
VVLFSRISSAITTALPSLDESDRLGFIREVASGNLSGVGANVSPNIDLHRLALESFAHGYASLFAASAAFCFVAAVATWLLVRDSDTPPIAKRVPLQPSPQGRQS